MGVSLGSKRLGLILLSSPGLLASALVTVAAVITHWGLDSIESMSVQKTEHLVSQHPALHMAEAALRSVFGCAGIVHASSTLKHLYKRREGCWLLTIRHEKEIPHRLLFQLVFLKAFCTSR